VYILKDLKLTKSVTKHIAIRRRKFHFTLCYCLFIWNDRKQTQITHLPQSWVLLAIASSQRTWLTPALMFSCLHNTS